MENNTILENLCSYDKRNPNHCWYEEDDEPTKPRQNCYCDNCFYGRDGLAREILRLKENIK
jgi:hypothetical protein